LEIDDELRKLATDNGKIASKELDAFKDYCESYGKTYKNYVAAFKNWLRRDFGTKKKEPMFGVASKAPKKATGEVKAFDLELHRRKMEFDHQWASLSVSDKKRVEQEAKQALAEGKFWASTLLAEMKKTA